MNPHINNQYELLLKAMNLDKGKLKGLDYARRIKDANFPTYFGGNVSQTFPGLSIFFSVHECPQNFNKNENTFVYKTKGRITKGSPLTYSNLFTFIYSQHLIALNKTVMAANPINPLCNLNYVTLFQLCSVRSNDWAPIFMDSSKFSELSQTEHFNSQFAAYKSWLYDQYEILAWQSTHFRVFRIITIETPLDLLGDIKL